MTLLELRDVSKTYAGIAAVRGVSLRLPSEGRAAVVGPSGCGKTTLLRLIAGFEAPDAGDILLGGELLADDTGATPAHRRGIGLVFQDGALFPHLSILDNIGFGIPLTDRDRAGRIVRLVDIVGLPQSVLRRQPHELSGGQQQRVALARAMARSPRLMLLDEPFSALDAGLRLSMCKAVVETLAEARIASILVTHDQEEALSYGQQIAVMHDGALSQVGPPGELYWRPQDRRTAEFLGDALILPAIIAGGVADCAIGRVPVAGGVSSQERATIMLRPQQVRLIPLDGAATAPGPNGHSLGEVVGVDFGGAASLVTVRLAAPAVAATEATLTLRQTSAFPLEAGDRVAFEVTGLAHILGEARA